MSHRLLKSTALLMAVMALSVAAWAVESAPNAGEKGLFPRITEVVLSLPNEAALETLAEGGFDVDHVRGLTATVYARDEELPALAALGWPMQVVGVQPAAPDGAKIIDGYRDNTDIGNLFAQYVADYPTLCRVYSLGDSVQNRPIWALKITQNPDLPADKPAVKFMSSIHGDEVLGLELCLNLAGLLLTQYGADSRIANLVNQEVIWLVPLLNPDGQARRTRTNANGYDLNRSFPAYGAAYTGNWFNTDSLNETGLPVEVRHLMHWSSEHSFVLAANFHGGSQVVNYPYDHEPGVSSGQPAISPDEALFRNLSLRYAVHNTPMYSSRSFSQGITNGSDWYAIQGSMQDWSYRFMGCDEVTIELADTKWPAASTLAQFWTDNRESMLDYLEAALIGVRGLVRDRNTQEPLRAQALVDGNTQPVFTDPGVGNYHRLLLPGNYRMEWQAEGYIPWRAKDITVTNGAATRVDVPLSDGDVNNDGLVTAIDVQLVVNAILGLAPAVNADVDGLGVSATDVQSVINQALGR